MLYKRYKLTCLSGEDKNSVITVDINPQLESNFIYADPSDIVKHDYESDTTDLDIRYVYSNVLAITIHMVFFLEELIYLIHLS